MVIRAIHPVEGTSPDLFALVIDLSEETTFRHEVLTGPDRLVIDLDRSFVTASAQRMTGKPLPAIGALRAGLFMAGNRAS